MSGHASVNLVGSLGADAQTRDVGQNTVTSFNVAVTTKEKGKESTQWFRCSLWGKRGDALAPVLTKGKRVFITGSLRAGTAERDGKTYMNLNVTVQDIVLLSESPQRSSNPEEDIPY